MAALSGGAGRESEDGRSGGEHSRVNAADPEGQRADHEIKREIGPRQAPFMSKKHCRPPVTPLHLRARGKLERAG